MIKTILCWLEYSRWFTLPVTVMSWFVAFIFAYKVGGNPYLGIVALLGICCAHMATNLIDDVFDYAKLTKQEGFDKKVLLTNAQKSKCRYLADGSATIQQTLFVIFLYCSIAIVCGLFLAYASGWQVLIFTLIGGLIALLYSKFSMAGLSELAVLLAYGPTLFGGIYYVMTSSFDVYMLIVCIPTAFLTVGLLYTHTLLDYDFDIKENKRTLCIRLKTKKNALFFLGILILGAYLTVAILVLINPKNYPMFLTYITIPLAFDLIKSLEMFNKDRKSIPQKRFWHFPMENLVLINQQGTANFMFRMYQARNLMVYFSILFAVSMFL